MARQQHATTENLGFLLAKASARWNEQLLARFAAHGFGEVRASYGSVLLPLFEEDGLRIGEIAARARLSKQSLTALVRGCEEAGLVARERDEADRRAFRVVLTRRGREFRRVAERVLAELNEEVTAALGRGRSDALVRALKEVMEL